MTIRSARPKNGFTIVELLVVIAIIAVLVALLLPAVQSVRESARIAQCANHLKQMGHAAQLHHTQWELLPSGGAHWTYKRTKASNGAPLRSFKQNWGWAYQILPFLEQQAAYENTDDAKAAAAIIPVYFCPSRRRPVALPGITNGLVDRTLRGALDYAGNGGYSSTLFPALNNENGVDGVIQPIKTTKRINLSDIKDGAGSTILLGERQYNRYFAADPLQAADENNGYIDGWDWDTIRWSNSIPARDRRDTTTYSHRFGGPHSGIAQFVFVDGSVRKLSYRIDPSTFRALCNRAAGSSPDPAAL